MNKVSFTALGNDLYAKVECDCPHHLPELAKLGIKEKLTLTGYDDSYFFDTVNAAPRLTTCKCGRELRYQWFRDGVEVEWVKK